MRDSERMKHSEEFDEENRPESKTRRKKDMIAVQKLGEELTTLSRKQLAKLPLPEQLLAALKEMERIPNSNEARRRHLQYIGRVMRDCDHEQIQRELDRLRTPDIAEVRRAQLIEQWGDRLLGGDEDTITKFVDAYPLADRQPLRQLQRNCAAAKERDENEMRVQRRRLLDYIKPFID
jgi:ribosome-associated protein